MSDPFQEIARLASVAELLVGCDYDGTLAPIVEDPARATPEEGAMEAVQGLAALPATHVVLVSGRSLDELARLSGAPPGVELVGSHGAEVGEGTALEGEAAERRRELVARLERIAARFPGATVEPKPLGAAFHYRRVEPGRREEAREAAEAAAEPDWAVRRGKQVVEAAVREADKGSALAAIRSRRSPSAVVYLGDDLTDEDVFATLRSGDVGIKVGEGRTRATHRLAGPAEVVRFLEELAAARRSRER